MCKEKKDYTKEYDYKFLDYRLTQLEQNLRKGQEKLETVQTQNYNELLKILQTLQENNQTQNQTLTELHTRIITLEQNTTCLEPLKEKTTEHNKQIEHIHHRLDIYKQILIIMGGAVITALVGLIFK